MKIIGANKSRNLHVVPGLHGGWSVRVTGTTRARRNFDTQRQAVGFARGVARDEAADIYVHDENGMIRRRVSFEIKADASTPERRETGRHKG